MLSALIVFFVLYLSVSRFYFWLRPKMDPHVLNVYFGVPGSGKTTFAAYLTHRSIKESFIIKLCKKHPNNFLANRILSGKLFKRSVPVYSNVPITGAFQLDAKSDLGHFMVEDAKIIIDEAGIEYNNRSFKSFPAENIYFFKYHRHYKTSIDVFSQSYEDMDITLRRLAQTFYVVKKSIIPNVIVCKKIYRKVGIDENTHQITDWYSFGLPLISSKRIWSPPLWKLFNSYSKKELPEKEFPIW